MKFWTPQINALIFEVQGEKNEMKQRNPLSGFLRISTWDLGFSALPFGVVPRMPILPHYWSQRLACSHSISPLFSRLSFDQRPIPPEFHPNSVIAPSIHRTAFPPFFAPIELGHFQRKNPRHVPASAFGCHAVRTSTSIIGAHILNTSRLSISTHVQRPDSNRWRRTDHATRHLKPSQCRPRCILRQNSIPSLQISIFTASSRGRRIFIGSCASLLPRSESWVRRSLRDSYICTLFAVENRS